MSKEESINEIVLKVVRDHLNYYGQKSDSITESSRFDEIGLDSLDVMEVVLGIEEVTETILEEDEYVKCETIASFIEIVKKQITG